MLERWHCWSGFSTTPLQANLKMGKQPLPVASICRPMNCGNRWQKKGNAEAQFSIGFLYDYGWGLPRDFAAAAQWYLRAAKQGHAEAQLSIGFMYNNGMGVAEDLVEAVKWYRLAAEQGISGGQSALGMMHESGRGLPKDHVRAYMWFEISIHDDSVARVKKKVEHRRDELAKSMTPAQVAEAKRLAREWLAKHSQE